MGMPLLITTPLVQARWFLPLTSHTLLDQSTQSQVWSHHFARSLEPPLTRRLPTKILHLRPPISRPLSRRLHSAGMAVAHRSPRRSSLSGRCANLSPHLRRRDLRLGSHRRSHRRCRRNTFLSRLAPPHPTVRPPHPHFRPDHSGPRRFILRVRLTLRLRLRRSMILASRHVSLPALSQHHLLSMPHRSL